MMEQTLNPVLQFLCVHLENFVSLNTLALELNISLKSLQEHINFLAQKGFVFTQKNNEICLHDSFPSKIIPEKIYASLQNPIDIFYYESSISTNVLAQQKILPHPFIIISKEQQGGKGRLGRSWSMQREQDICMTFSLPLQWKPQNFFSLVTITAVSVFDTLNHYAPDEFFIKWPNDIYTKSGKKIAGILIETSFNHNQCTQIISGIGININSSNLSEYATSLKNITHSEIDMNECYAFLINNFMQLWNTFPDNQQEIFQYWKNQLLWRQEQVYLIQDEKEYIGIFKDVQSDGAIVLEINGQDKVFVTGDLLNLSLRKNRPT